MWISELLESADQQKFILESSGVLDLMSWKRSYLMKATNFEVIPPIENTDFTQNSF